MVGTGTALWRHYTRCSVNAIWSTVGNRQGDNEIPEAVLRDPELLTAYIRWQTAIELRRSLETRLAILHLELTGIPSESQEFGRNNAPAQIYAPKAGDTKEMFRSLRDMPVDAMERSTMRQFYTPLGDPSESAMETPSTPPAVTPTDAAVPPRTSIFGGKLIGVISGVSDIIRVAVSDKGHWLAGGRRDGTIHLWDTTNGEQVACFRSHTTDILGLSFTVDGSHLYSCSADGTFAISDTVAGRRLRTFTGHTNWVHDVVVLSDGRRAITASGDGHLKLWDTASDADPDAIRTFEGHTAPVWGVAVSDDMSLVASASDDRTVRLWSLPQGILLHILTGHKTWVRSVAIAPDGRTVASGSDDGAVMLWDAKSGLLRHTLLGHSATVRFVAYSADNEVVLSASKDGSIRAWYSETGVSICMLPFETNGMVAFSPGTSTLATGADDGCIRLYSVGKNDDSVAPKG